MYIRRLIAAGVIIVAASVGAAAPNATAAPAGQFVASTLWLQAAPTKASCNKATKALKDAVRLAEKNNSKLSQKRKNELQAKINNGTITSHDLPGQNQREFPGEFAGKTLSQIESECSSVK